MTLNNFLFYLWPSLSLRCYVYLIFLSDSEKRIYISVIEKMYRIPDRLQTLHFSPCLDSCGLFLYQLADAEVSKEMDVCEFDRCSEADLGYRTYLPASRSGSGKWTCVEAYGTSSASAFSFTLISSTGPVICRYVSLSVQTSILLYRSFLHCVGEVVGKLGCKIKETDRQ